MARSGRHSPRHRRGTAGSGAAGLAVMFVLVLLAGHFGVLPFAQFKGESTQGTVQRVVDGDTIDVQVDGTTTRVRILAVDAPEVGSSPDCFGPDATQHLADLLSQGATVQLVTDPSQPALDRYDRALAYVEVAGVDVGKAMVEAGMARAWRSSPPAQRYGDYFATQHIAQAEAAGQWGACDK